MMGNVQQPVDCARRTLQPAREFDLRLP